MKKLLLYLLLFSSFNLNAQVPSYVPTDSLVGWWPFNGNANDGSGNGNNGIVTGATLTVDQFANPNSAYNFDGTNEIIIQDDDMLDGNNEYSVSIWFKTFDLGGGAATNFIPLFSKWYTIPEPDSTSYLTYMDGTNLVSYFHDGISYDSIARPINYTVNQWVHYTSVFNNGLVKIYLNAVLIGEKQLSITSINNSLEDLKIGQWFGNRNPSYTDFVGDIDDLGMWNRALDSCEILDLYNASLGNCCALNPITSQPTNQSTSIGNNATFSFTDNLTGAIYQWQMDAGTGYSDLSNAGQFSGADTDSLIISTTTMGNHNTLYRCIVTESASCMDTTDVSTLTVIDNTSIGELNNSLVKLFPNPSNSIITLTLAQHSNYQIILNDILGKVVLSKSFTSNEVQLNLKSLESKGTYFAKVLDSSGNVIAIKKLIYQ